MMFRRSIALILAFAVSTPAAAAGLEMRARRLAPERGIALLQAAMLDAHNRTRAQLGLRPLSWSPALAGDAAHHAQVLARTGRMFHAEQSGGAAWQGENLFAGTRGSYAYADMANYWLDERRVFRNRPFPAISTTGHWQDAAHYAQMVSRDTTEVGCALAEGQFEDFLVCRYAPGETRGRRAY
ncbi:CAP domain-containing protein [Sphingomonas endophytica]|uniref:SCP domain-containing protein n=1 Tax=Sphingomonas endophytica TaxID=869719 RepID=A0A147I4T4_9SPHN|nr:CAP domain-containing protein [Sphingomonas endophytica]KTT73468.1 hypothetical protein NS334_07530 [Sphingomonas endophytica]